MQRRLSTLEGSAEPGSPEALIALREALARHRRTVEDAIVLDAGTNVQGPLAHALHDPTMGSRPSMGRPGEKLQTGLEEVERVEVLATEAVAASMHARFAEVRMPSASLANLAVYTAVARPGDTIAVLPAQAGGHASHHEVGAPGVRGLRVVDLPYDTGDYDVDLGELDAFLLAQQPALIVLGASLLMFPHRLDLIVPLARAHGARVLYDASHVSGLVAAGRFQQPLAEGADVMTFSTYSSFGGPVGGAIVTDDAELAEQISAVAYPSLTANHDSSRMAPLAVAAGEMIRFADAYATQAIANARRLAERLHTGGLHVVGATRGFTASHQLAVDVTPLGAREAADRLAAAGILLSTSPYPGGVTGIDGLRIGTQEVTRRGFHERDMDEVGRLILALLVHDADPAAVGAEVRALRRAHPHVRFAFEPDLPGSEPLSVPAE